MYNYTLSLIVSFIAMGFIVTSYFLKRKSLYLSFQGTGIVFLILSFFFTEEFFAMIGITIGLIRTVTFFLYEKKDKDAPLWLSFLFAGATVAVYFIVNLGILKTAKPVDILYLIGLIFYAFTFRIRSLKTMRLVTVVPTTLNVLYAVFISATPFVIISYVFECGANLLAVLRFDVFGKRKEIQTK
ncbi:MAG: YgjV family protein [Clostridia bacterium]|nr:YgjV family protein [Clostridia bacterium]